MRPPCHAASWRAAFLSSVDSALLFSRFRWLLQQQGGRLVVVIPAADVIVVRPRPVAFQLEHRLPVERMFQDGFQALVGIYSQQRGPLAGRLQAGRREGFRQTKNAQAGAIPRFRVRLTFQDGPYHFRTYGSDGRRPVNQARGRPLQMGLMAFGTVLVQCGGVVWDKTASM